jgi:flavin reductase (DIM6/NTAB) family NADH-FMN oxidoreductase RutF
VPKSGKTSGSTDISTNRKTLWKPGAMLSPLPVVMLTCQPEAGPPNIITVAWIGTVCTHPPMLSVSLMPSRYSYPIIRQTGEFVVNIPSADEARATDQCGVLSGRDVDKFLKTGLTSAPSKEVRPPVIAECPINIECRVRQHIDLGSHTLFLAEILAVQVSSRLITASGRLALEKAKLIAYSHGHYYTLGKELGHFGFSVRKHPIRKQHSAGRKKTQRPA